MKNIAFYHNKLKNVESKIMEEAKHRVETISLYRQKGLQWAYNKVHFEAFWCTRNPELLNIMYKSEMYPSYIEVEISSVCPYKCNHCEHTFWQEPGRLMSFDEFKLIIDNFPELKQMSMTGIGDSWVNPIFMDCIRYVKNKDVFFEQYDEFQHFDKDTAEEFVKLGVERLIWSMDAATKETFEKKRVGQSWDKAIEGINNLKEAKKKFNSFYPEINYHFVIDSENIHEVYDAIDLAKKLDTGGFIQYSRLLHSFPEIKHLYTEIPETMQQTIMNKANILKVPVVWNANVPSCLPPLNVCTAVYQPFFFVTGDVITCCAQHESNRRTWEKTMSMGNIFIEKDFKKIWYGEKYRKLRQLLLENRLPDACVECPIQLTKNKTVYKTGDVNV